MKSALPPAPGATVPPAASSGIPLLIVGVFVGFALFIGSMVKQAMGTSVELVSADYYAQELVYQQRIAAVARTAALPAPVRIVPDAATATLAVSLPAALHGQAIAGTIRFFRPSNVHLDFSVPFQPDAAGRQLLNTASLAPGRWRLRLEFTAGSAPYYVEEIFDL